MQVAARTGPVLVPHKCIGATCLTRKAAPVSSAAQRTLPLQRVRTLTSSSQCQCSNGLSTTSGWLSNIHGAVDNSSGVRRNKVCHRSQQLRHVVISQSTSTAKCRQQAHGTSATVAAAAATTGTHLSNDDVLHSTWTAPCGTVFEVIELRSQQQLQHHDIRSSSSSSSSSKRPPVILIHGLFRAAWYWTNSLMPLLAAAGHDSYALSLRGQGTSQLLPAAGTSNDQQQQQPIATSSSSSSSSMSSQQQQHPFSHGIPLAVNVADIGAFITSKGFSQPPILIGHSLGGMFVQEYLHTLIWQQQQQQSESAAAAEPSAVSSATPAAAAAAALPHIDAPLPPLSAAVLLASACAGTVMSFGRFIADVGVLEFLYQMYIVLSHAHLNDLSTARYCWWQEDMSESEAKQHLAAIRSSSTVLPYITAEVGGWYPPAPSADELQLLPPVLSVGGSADRIIRPFQVVAAGDYWGADVRVLDGVTHDVLLGPQAADVSREIVSWIEALPANTSRAPGAAAVVGAMQQEAMKQRP